MTNGDFTIGPDYTLASETSILPGVPVGAIHAFTMLSAIYPGIRRLENEITKRRDAFGNRGHASRCAFGWKSARRICITTIPEETWHNWPLANRRMAAALAAKGYPYRFTLSLGGRHADPRVVEQTLPGALEWLWQDYPRLK